MAWSARCRSAPSRCGGGWTRTWGHESPRASASSPAHTPPWKLTRADETLERSMKPMRIADPLTRRSLYAGLIIGLLLATGSVWAAREERPTTTKPVCADDNGGITLPAGFCATVFADNIGHARHLVVAPNGVVYVNTWSGRYYGNDTPPTGGVLVGLLDSKGEGRADVIVRFGESVQTGSGGGTRSPPSLRAPLAAGDATHRPCAF